MPPTGSTPRPADLPLLRRIAEAVLPRPAQRERFFQSNRQYGDAGVTDYFFATPDLHHDPDRIFHRLRWGGQLIYASPRRREAQAVLARFRGRPEFVIDQDVQAITAPRFPRLPRLPFHRHHHYFIARKVLLTQPGVATDRYSYDVHLEPRSGSAPPSSPDPPTATDHYIVLKQVPTLERAIARLALRFPTADALTIEKGARKLVNKVFPIFLTREAALLKIVQRDLPEPYRGRVPSILDLETDERGLVRKMRLNWLRLGGDTISQLEFARQAAELLHVLHDRVGVIHLDLRLDNVVVTPGGVGFVDFGSAVRVGEDFSTNPMLSALFGEMLSTSQIQRDLHRLVAKHKVTSPLFTDCCHKMDKAADLFYLVLQMNNPHGNPDFKGLVHHDPQGPHARALSRLSRAVLNPKIPHAPRYQSAHDVLRGIERAQRRLAG